MNNKITSVALIGDGTKGLKATVEEMRQVNGGIIPKTLVERQKVAVPSELSSAFRSLRYYLLESTERIAEEWRPFFKDGEFQTTMQLKGDAQKKRWADCQDMLDRTVIDGVTRSKSDDNEGFTISGRIYSKNGYVSKTESPLLTDENSTIFFREVSDRVGSIFNLTLEYLYGNKLAIVQETVRQLSEEDGNFSNLSEEEQLRKAAKLLEKRGCIIITDDEAVAKTIGDSGNDVTSADDEVFSNVTIDRPEGQDDNSSEVVVTKTIFEHTDFDDEAEEVVDEGDATFDTLQEGEFELSPEDEDLGE